VLTSICTGSARFRRKSSPEVRRNLVDAKVRRGFVGARVIETERGWRRWKEDTKEIAGYYLLAEIESDFIFPFFLILEINFGLKVIPGNPEILIKSRKYSESSENSGKLLEMIWVKMNPNKLFGAHEKDFRAC
jgi:hypothetical protein